MSMRWTLVLLVPTGILLLMASCGGDDGADDARAVAERFAAAYDEGDASAVAALFATDGRWDDLSADGPRVQGRDAVRDEFSGWFASVLPANHTFEYDIMIADEDTAVGSWSEEWTENDKTERLDGIAVFEVADGEIVQGTNYYDSGPVEDRR